MAFAAHGQAVASAASSITGQYAFYLHGQESGPGGVSQLVGLAGSVATDGNGHVTAGVLDKNSAGGLIETSTVSGTYQLDTTGKGVFNLVTPAGSFGFTFYIAPPQANTLTQGFITAGTGTILEASGEIGPALPYLFYSAAPVYALSEEGETGPGTGTFQESASLAFTPAASSSAGTLTGSVVATGTRVMNGVATQFNGLAGTFRGPYAQAGYPADGAVGRFAVVLASPAGGDPGNYVAYAGLFPSGGLFLLRVDAHPALPLEVSTVVSLQQAPSQ